MQCRGFQLSRIGYRHYSSKSRKFDCLFLGRDLFSCATFEALHNAPDVWNSITVVTTPDQSVGRGRKHKDVSPLKLKAHDIGLSVLEAPKTPEAFTAWNLPDSFNINSPTNALITASFGQAVPLHILELFTPSLRLNVHPSLLPKYRGAAPIQRTIADGTQNTGVTILQMEDIGKHGFDAGPTWAQRPVDIPPRPDYATLRDILSREGGSLLVEFLRRRLTDDTIQSQAQDHFQKTRARIVTKKTALVKWNEWNAEKVDRMHRAISHQYPLHSAISPHDTSVQFLDVEPHPTSDDSISERLKSPGEGTLDQRTGRLVVRCAGDTYVHIGRLQTENRKETSAKDWWNGVKGKSDVVNPQTGTILFG